MSRWPFWRSRGSGQLEKVQKLFDDAYLGADRVLDYGQMRVFRLLGFFIPAPSLAREPRFEQILASRFLSDAGQQALAYGALVAVVRAGGSAFDAALIGVAMLVPSALFGLHGGAVADALPKRLALAAAYNLQALLCFVVPLILGTGLPYLLLLVFAVNTLAQVSTPTESAVLPLVASQAELASAASLVNLASAAGSGFGTALLAPLLVRAFGVEIVLYMAGALLLLAASRVFDLPTGEGRPKVQWAIPRARVRAAAGWLLHQPALTTMIIVGALAGTANIVLQTLAPRYVQSVLLVDAADTVYVFAPSAVGLVVALLAAPSLMELWGERRVALLGFSVVAVSLFLLGLVGQVAGIVDPINPIRILELAGIELSQRLRTAGLLAVPTGFGVALAATCVQTYVNRRVPLRYQGRSFAIQGSLKSGASIVPLLALGAAASAVGVEKVLLASPVLLLALASILV
ncbi:MAG TPA: MFS transporter, partial [Dehalococcoidia bacterium]|nr:MFS transporter [Dehalococcoidia bacterium]